MAELENVRRVLDYAPPEKMPHGAYYDALNRRINREVAVNRVAAAAPKVKFKPGRDEALLVVPPEEWDAAIAARRTQQERDSELARVQNELHNLQGRHDEVAGELDQLRERYKGEQDRTALQLVGVRKAEGSWPAAAPPPEPEPIVVPPPVEPEPVPEPEPAPVAQQVVEEWETVEEPAVEEAATESVTTAEEPPPPTLPTEDELREGGWVLPSEAPPEPAPPETVEPVEDDVPVATTYEPVGGPPPGPLEEPPTGEPMEPAAPDPRLAAMEHQIERSERELEKVEDELKRLEERERELQAIAPAGPYTTGDYTLYRRDVKRGKTTRPLYFFSKSKSAIGTPSPKPPGYLVATNPKTGLPYLKSATKAAKKAKAKRGK